MTEEKRYYPRKPYFMPVDYIDRNRIYREYIIDISAGGIFIKTENSVPVGNEISLTLPFPSQSYITISGVVVRNAPEGIAVRFHRSDLELVSRLESLVEEIKVVNQSSEWG
ncbi:MAG: PilZ domain-containing protein [Desulfobacteraceae bacterium]|nr:PilZ domain-containing protein [Desulfobacteraceae bacterium]MCB9494487.1 PilZ domain-containing protein [Desulfobacteraceae bacterium]